MHHLISIFLTLLIFLTGGNFAVAKNQASSAPLADLCTSAVRISVEEVFHRQDAKGEKVFKTCFEAFPKSACDFSSLPISASLGDLCALAVNSSSTHTTTGPIATIIPTHTQSFTVNDRLTTDTYDANGNTLVSKEGGTGVPPVSSSSVTDVYSFDNKLIRRTTPDGKIIDLTYHPDGHRLSKFITQNALTQRLVHYLTDTNNPTGYAQVIEEKHPLEPSYQQLKKVNLYGHELICSVGLQQSSSSPLTPPASLLYYNYDGLGSVRSISNATGDLQETYDYNAYGTLIGLAKRNTSTGVLESLNTENFKLATSSYLYTGEQWDSDLNMYFLRARYLNTNTGRFHTQDTYEGRNGEPLTLHKYLYANGNPATFTDPSGKFTLLGEQITVQNFLVNFAVNFGTSSIISILSGEKISDALIDGAIGGVFGGIGGTLSKPLGALLSKMQNPLLAFAFRIIFNTAFAIASSYVDQFIDVKTGKQPDGMSKARTDVSFATALTISMLGEGLRFAEKEKIDTFLDYAMPILAVQAGMLSDEFTKGFENLKKTIEGRSNLIETIE